MNLAGETLKSPETLGFPGFLLFLGFVRRSDFDALYSVHFVWSVWSRWWALWDRGASI